MGLSDDMKKKMDEMKDKAKDMQTEGEKKQEYMKGRMDQKDNDQDQPA